MRTNESVEKLIAGLRATPSAELDARVHGAIDDALAARERTRSTGWLPNLGRIIMQTRTTKWAVSAAFVLAMGVLVAVLNKAPSAFGLERVIEAYNHVRFLHVKTFGAGREEPNEFWIQSDKLGSVARAR